MTKKTTYKADFVKAQQYADDVLKENNIRELPVRVKKIVKSFPNLKVRTYSWFAKKRGYSHREVCDLVDSDEGCCLYYESLDEYLILYNDRIANKGRKRWTLAHELGHYILNHNKRTYKSSLARSSLTEEEYNEFESEANCFARELLAPPPVLNELNVTNPSNISNICDISGEASVNVYKFLKQGAQFGIKYPPNNPVLQLFSDFINKLKNCRRCIECNFTFIEQNARFCPSCGHNDLVKGFSYKQTSIVNTIDVDRPDKTVKRCPRCKYDEFGIDSNYCKICGTYIINKCTGFHCNEGDRLQENIKWHAHPGGCRERLDIDARYCHKCGATSTFLEDGLINAYSIKT
ncbi:ImmA/IrrE family metallo-endopeptidase [Pseudalkalibacillus sp. R45]|uniref:ImmA/IrrE family metallo-endopeptidase n=1 Tax=Pseudalkalibacillus sp. R45 TaxID=3457433 RepID=UPI003FCC5C26